MIFFRTTSFLRLTAVAFVFLKVISTSAYSAENTLLLYADYSLPLTAADEASLQPFNNFHINAYTIDKTPGQEQMNFRLPADLTAGTMPEITMRLISTRGSDRHFAGPHGEAECKGPWTSINCQFTFKDLNLDVLALEQFALMKYGKSERSKAIASLAAQFGNDPIGFGQVIPFENEAPNSHPFSGAWTLDYTDFYGRTLDVFSAEFDRNQVYVFNSIGTGIWTMTYFNQSAFGTWKMDDQEGWLILNLSKLNTELNGIWGLKGQFAPLGTFRGRR